MPKFIARLEAQDGSGHFRRVRIFADSETAARVFLESRELRSAGFQLDDAELAKLEAKDRLSGGDRAKLALHNQEQPYVLVSLEETDA